MIFPKPRGKRAAWTSRGTRRQRQLALLNELSLFSPRRAGGYGVELRIGPTACDATVADSRRDRKVSLSSLRAVPAGTAWNFFGRSLPAANTGHLPLTRVGGAFTGDSARRAPPSPAGRLQDNSIAGHDLTSVDGFQMNHGAIGTNDALRAAGPACAAAHPIGRLHAVLAQH